MSLPVPYSYRTYAGDGTTDVFSVPFPYIVKAHVRVYVNWSVDNGLFDAELLDGVGFNWVGDTSINVTTAPTAPDTISVVRLTPVDQRVTQWQAGSPPTAFELTAADEQVLFVVQEFIDRVLATQGTLNFVISDGLTTVIDNLLSTSPTAALSANQGRVLKGLIDALATAVDGIIAGGGGGGGETITVEDILTSTSATNALSANMGRVLKELIDALSLRVEAAEAQNLANQSAIFQTQAAILDTSQVPAGTIVWLQPPATPATPPVGFLYGSGTERVRAEYPELFNTIGTTYGSGNGTTTFNLPLEASLTNPFPGAVPPYAPYVRTGLAFPVSGVVAVFPGGTNVLRSQSLSGSEFSNRADFSIGYTNGWATITKDAQYAACGRFAASPNFNIVIRAGNAWSACTFDALPVGENPRNGVFGINGDFLFVTCTTQNYIYTRTGQTTWVRASAPGPASPGSLELSYTGNFIYSSLSLGSGGNGSIKLWGVSGTTITFVTEDAFPGHRSGYIGGTIGWSPGDSLVSTLRDRQITRCDLFARAGSSFFEAPAQPAWPNDDHILNLFSPDSLYLVNYPTTQRLRLYKSLGGVFTLKNSAPTDSGNFTNTNTRPIPGRSSFQFFSTASSRSIFTINTTTDTLEKVSDTTGFAGAADGPVSFGLIV